MCRAPRSAAPGEPGTRHNALDTRHRPQAPRHPGATPQSPSPATVLLPRHPAVAGTRRDANPAGRRSSVLPPQLGSCALLHRCSALGARGRSRLFPEQPPDDAHCQGYNLAKHSAGALEGAGPRRLISQSRTHRARTCHSNEGACTGHAGSHRRGTYVQGPSHPTRIPWGRGWVPPGSCVSAGQFPLPGRSRGHRRLSPLARGQGGSRRSREGVRERGVCVLASPGNRRVCTPGATAAGRRCLHASPFCAGVSVHPCLHPSARTLARAGVPAAARQRCTPQPAVILTDNNPAVPELGWAGAALAAAARFSCWLCRCCLHLLHTKGLRSWSRLCRAPGSLCWDPLWIPGDGAGSPREPQPAARDLPQGMWAQGEGRVQAGLPPGFEASCPLAPHRF